MKTAIVIIIVALGSVVFHLLSPWWWTPIASNWSYIDHTIELTFWITGIVFVAVVLFVAYCIYNFRHEEGRKAIYEPENKKLELWLTVATGIGVAAMLATGLFVGAVRNVPAGAAERKSSAAMARATGLRARTESSARITAIHHTENNLGVNKGDRAARMTCGRGRRDSCAARPAGQSAAPRRGRAA